MSQRKRKRVEQPCGWMKTYGLLRKAASPRSRQRGLAVPTDGHGLQNHSFAGPQGMRKVVPSSVSRPFTDRPCPLTPTREMGANLSSCTIYKTTPSAIGINTLAARENPAISTGC